MPAGVFGKKSAIQHEQGYWNPGLHGELTQERGIITLFQNIVLVQQFF